MKTLRMLTVAATLGLPGATAYAAGRMLATAPAIAAYPSNQTIDCSIVNLNSSPSNVTIDLVDYSGNVVQTGTFTLLPSQGYAVGDVSGNGAWCRFIVDGSPKTYRAMAIYDNHSTYTVAVPAQ